MRNKFFIVIILILFILGITIFIMPQRSTSTFERRKLHKNSDIDITKLANTSIEVLNDQFPLRDECIKTLFKLKNIFNESFTGNKLLKVKDDVIHFSDGYYINNYYKITESEKDVAMNKAYNIQEISNRYPNIQVYLYFPTRIEETKLLDNESVLSVFPELKEEFIAQLGDKVKIESLKIESVDDYCNKFYKTDLHWNGYGVYDGYKDIINMINKDFDVGEPKTAEFTTYPYKFYGSYALKIGFMCNPDNLIDMEINTDKYEYYVNGEKTDDVASLKDYRENGNIDQLLTDYELVYGGNDFIRVYNFNQVEKPNILIFADSYINPLKKALASHFNKTVIVDMRANDGTFNLDKIIKDNKINIILFLQQYEDLYFNGYLFVPLD